jgi:protein TonB
MDLGNGDRFEFEVAELAAEPPPPQKPPEPEPEPEPPIEPVVSKPRVKSPTPKPLPQPTPEPAPPLRFDLRSLGGSGTSGIVVEVGESGAVSDGLGRGTGKKVQEQEGGGAAGTSDGWAPASELSLESMPAPLSVPRIQCQEAIELGLEGTVVLEVQVRDDGKIRQVKVLKGMGNGCDQVARKALRGARFTPAIDRNGRKVDFQLRYEYEFKLSD